MGLDFKERTIYANLSWDKDKGKKKAYFGGQWGSLKKSEANTVAFKTGDGLVIVDIDTQDLGILDKKIAKELKKITPTVTTARGYHYYFEHKMSAEFVNTSDYSKFVDVRSDGGIIFAQYRGDNSNISYKRTGDVYKKMPTKLRSRLLELMVVEKQRKQLRETWSEAPRGNRHDAIMSYIGKDFTSGLSYQEVFIRAMDYVAKYLGNSAQEIQKMKLRVDDGLNYSHKNKLEHTKQVVSNEPMEIGGELEDFEIREMLAKAQKGGSLELERVMKELKKKLKISMSTLRDMLKEGIEGTSGIQHFFDGEVFWDRTLNAFVEVHNKGVEYYPTRTGFIQTVSSNSGWMETADVTKELSSIKSRSVLYKPDMFGRDIVDKWDKPAINSYRPTNFKGKGKKIPKNINRLLDNIFLSDPKAKEYYLNWLAYIVQHKKKTGVAWGFFGASGTGKGILSDIVMRLVGADNSSMNISDTDLQSTFNGYIYRKMFLHLNEVASDFHGRNGVAGKLKAVVTDTHLQVNMKNLPIITCENYCNVMLNSNKPNPIELDNDDRRWNMIVTNKPLTSCSWFKLGTTGDKMLEESSEFGAYLMNFKIDMKKALNIMTKSVAKENVIAQTTSSLSQLGNLIRKSDTDNLLEFLQLDTSEFDISEREVKKSVKSGFWSSHLLKQLYVLVTGKGDITPQIVTRYLIKPYITNGKSVVQNGNRGYIVTHT